MIKQKQPKCINRISNAHTPKKRSVGILNKDKEIEAYLAGELGKQEQIKYEIAQELGILDQVLKDGWKSLSAKETGRIGGLMTKRKNKK